MANKRISFEDASNAFNEILLTGSSTSGISYEEAFEILEKANKDQLQILNADYWKPEQPGVYYFVFEGIEKTIIKEQETEIVKLRTKEGKSYITGATVLVNACRKLTTIPAFIYVDYKGLKGKKPNEYMDIEVRTFVK